MERHRGNPSFLKMGQNGLFCLFFILVFSHEKCSTNLTINDKSMDGVLGSRTRGGRIVGADKSTELSWHPTKVQLITIIGT